VLGPALSSLVIYVYSAQAVGALYSLHIRICVATGARRKGRTRIDWTPPKKACAAKCSHEQKTMKG
jgi:hypothetical protein